MAWTEERKQKAREAYQNRVNFLHKTEICNDEYPVEKDEEEENRDGLGFKMSYEEKLQSMLNAIKILPPNMIKDGRHLKENVQALNCFKVTDAMMEEVYQTYTHPEY